MAHSADDDDVSPTVVGEGEAAATVAVSSGFKNKSAVANDIFVAYSQQNSQLVYLRWRRNGFS